MLAALLADRLGRADGEAYDQFVGQAAGAHYSQARGWAELARAGRPLGARYFLARDGVRVVGAGLVLSPTLFGLCGGVAWLERGPVCADPSDLPRVLGVLGGAARRRGIARLAVMPYFADAAAQEAAAQLGRARFRDVQQPDGSHVATLRIDLDALRTARAAGAAWQGKPYAALRAEIARAMRAGASVRPGGPADLPGFARLDAEMMTAQGKRARPAAWFAALAGVLGQHRLWVCEAAGAPVAMLLCAHHGGTATFVAGASTAAHARFPKMVLPLAAAVDAAVAAGCHTFDLGGTPMAGDDDPKRAAIARFKQEFSRSRVTLVNRHARWLWLP